MVIYFHIADSNITSFFHNDMVFNTIDLHNMVFNTIDLQNISLDDVGF